MGLFGRKGPAAATGKAVATRPGVENDLRTLNRKFDEAKAAHAARTGRTARGLNVLARIGDLFGRQPGLADVEALDPRMKVPRVQLTGPSANALTSRATLGLARHAYKNNGHIKKGLRGVASRIAGTGPMPNSRFGELQKVIRAHLPNIDARGRLSWGQFCRAAVLMDRVDGEVWFRKRPRWTRDGLILPQQYEILESEQVAHGWTKIGSNGNRIIDGVELDACNRPFGYWTYPEHPNDGLMQALNATANVPGFVPATQMLHVFSSFRTNSWRGDSSLLPALVTLYNLSSYQLAEATRKNVSTMFVGTFTREPGQEGGPLPFEEESGDALGYKQTLTELSLEPGMLAELPAGSKIDWNDPPDTGTSYEPYVRFQLAYLASCCDSTYEDFTGDWRGANDRTWRAAQVAIRAFADEERDRLEKQLLNPIWRDLVDLAIAMGLWTPPAGVQPWEYYEVRWSWPGSKNPNQYQEYNSLLLAIQAGLMSRDAAIREMGEDPIAVDEENAEGKRRSEGQGLFYSSYLPRPPGSSGAPGTFEGIIQGIVEAQVEERLRQRLADLGGKEVKLVNPDAVAGHNGGPSLDEDDGKGGDSKLDPKGA